MRTNIVHPGAKELVYEIRGIVALAQEFEKLGKKIIWENIGDPLTAGEKLPLWLKKIVNEETKKDESYAYCPTKGVLETREYIVKKRKEQKIKIDVEDILFFNGLGDAIATIYFYINKHSRVIGPNPAYPAHSSAESARVGEDHISYKLVPEKNWEPDFQDLENKIKYNPVISGILIINPGNPTSKTFSKETLEKFVTLAEKYDLFLIADEVYADLAYDKEKFVSMAELKKDVPLILMKGLSKEVPWPGARCGWVEFYNKDKDKNFNDFTESIVNAKMLEVCATTLPQRVLPKIYESKDFEKYTKKRIQKYIKRAEFAYNVFSQNENLLAPKPDGAFYYTIVFKKNILKKKFKLNIENKKIEKRLNKTLKKVKDLDKRFVYYLMAETGIVTVPLSGFNSDELGFRITLLQENDKLFEKIILEINEKINEFLSS